MTAGPPHTKVYYLRVFRVELSPPARRLGQCLHLPDLHERAHGFASPLHAAPTVGGGDGNLDASAPTIRKVTILVLARTTLGQMAALLL